MIAEPVTLATDYVLAAACGATGTLLYLRADGQRSRRFWAAALVALALTALLGGTYHGFRYEMSRGAALWLWKYAVLLTGLASFGFVAGSAVACTSGRLRWALIALATLKALAYEGWMLRHDDFVWVIADTGGAMAVVFVLHAVTHRAAGSRWILAGVALSAAGAAAQASGFSLHEHFNHNDLYHVLQTGATLLFYRGARRLRDLVA
jgi:hypothetical protein